jgi:hypothetical protein
MIDVNGEAKIGYSAAQRLQGLQRLHGHYDHGRDLRQQCGWSGLLPFFPG